MDAHTFTYTLTDKHTLSNTHTHILACTASRQITLQQTPIPFPPKLLHIPDNVSVCKKHFSILTIQFTVSMTIIEKILWKIYFYLASYFKCKSQSVLRYCSGSYVCQTEFTVEITCMQRSKSKCVHSSAFRFFF